MLCTLHNHAVVVVVSETELEVTLFVESHINKMTLYICCPRCYSADGPSPQKGRQCSPGSVWAASGATLAFPICGFDPFVT